MDRRVGTTANSPRHRGAEVVATPAPTAAGGNIPYRPVRSTEPKESDPTFQEMKSYQQHV